MLLKSRVLVPMVSFVLAGSFGLPAWAQSNTVAGSYVFFDGYDAYSLTFDGTGNYSGQTIAPDCARTESGTYTVSSSGLVTIPFKSYEEGACGSMAPTSVTYVGQISVDGNQILGKFIWALRAGFPNQGNLGLGASAQTGTTSGTDNTSVGAYALEANTTGASNAALGYGALTSNSTGYNNNATGAYALAANTTGYFNNAAGYYSMYANTAGYNNNAQGSYALSANTVGYGNSAMGANSFVNMVDGCRNVGVGNNTGTALINSGQTAPPYDCYNTYIGWGISGTEGDSGVTRIGNSTYATATYIGGVYSATAGGNAVCVSSNGQLSGGTSCTSPSSRRYKEDIQPLTDTERLMQLEPVSFHYRQADASGNKPLEYGLLAEQVAAVYPELVAYDAQGRPDAIRYQDFTPLLIRKVQQQEIRLQEQAAMLEQQADRLQEQDQKLQEMKELRDRLVALENQMHDRVLAASGSPAAPDHVAMR